MGRSRAAPSSPRLARLLAAFFLEGPFDGGGVAVDHAEHHQLLAPAHLAPLAHIDALGEGDIGALDAHAPAAAAWQLQQRRLAVLGDRGLDLGMQMEAERKSIAAGAADDVLAHQLIAIAGQEQAAAMEQAEALVIAIMAGIEPDLAIGLFPPA